MSIASDRPDPITLLWPAPRRAESGDGVCLLPRDPIVASQLPAGSGEGAVERLLDRLGTLGLAPRRGPIPQDEETVAIRLALEPGRRRHPQGYSLDVRREGIRLAAGGDAGLFYGACTLVQWIALHGARTLGDALAIPALRVEDRPDLERRGVLLDVSRDKVPTMASLRDLVDLLSGWKVNQIQLYTEHTFAYPGHEIVWRDASPLTPEEIRELDLYCRQRHVELVPNQNSFGHLHRWLVHQPYRGLAESPEGIVHPWSEVPEPYGLCPTDPDCLVFLAGLYDQLLPNFSSPQLNVGLDETLDLGLGRSREACERRGVGRVYLDFLRGVHRLVSDRGRVMQYWDDVVVAHRELIPELPPDAIALDWGYEADHPFEERAALFRSAGLPFYLCPGAGGWNSIGGRAGNAVANLSRAALAGRDGGAEGLLVAEWGDNGHWQPLAVSLLGLLVGAGLSWNASPAEEDLGPRIAPLLDAHAYGDAAGVLGEAAVGLGEVHLETGVEMKNRTALFEILASSGRSMAPLRDAGLSPARLAATEEEIDRIAGTLRQAATPPREGGLAARELRWAADLMRFACRLGEARLAAGAELPVREIPAPARSRLAEELAPLVDAHGALWLARNRPGGLADSRGRLERILGLLA